MRIEEEGGGGGREVAGICKIKEEMVVEEEGEREGREARLRDRVERKE